MKEINAEITKLKEEEEKWQAEREANAKKLQSQMDK